MSDSFKNEFFKTLFILKDYLPDIVISGGWAPYIYYRYLLSDKTNEPLRTKDIDIVVPEKLRERNDKSLDMLLTEAGFKTRFKSRHAPPVISYEGKIGDFEVEIEFLTHHRGSRDGQAAVVQSGLHAQMLRFINILIENSITVEIEDFKIGHDEFLKIRVPSPGAFIFQKGLTFPRRKRRIKSAKDLYYIFDMLVRFEGELEQIAAEIITIGDSYPSTWLKQFKRNLIGRFSEIDDNGVKMVHSQRPEQAFPALNDEQFRQYVLGVFQGFISRI